MRRVFNFFRHCVWGQNAHTSVAVSFFSCMQVQLLLGLREGNLTQALKVYVRRNPDQDFAAIKEEALLLDAECSSLQTEVTCTSIDGSSRIHPSQDNSWKENLEKEILDDFKVQITSLTQELLKELKPLFQPVVAEPLPRQPPRREIRPAAPTNQWDEQGRLVCRLCK